jgi:hypothetical protein
MANITALDFIEAFIHNKYLTLVSATDNTIRVLDNSTQDLKVLDSISGKGMKEVKSNLSKRTNYISTNDPGIILWPPGNDQLAVVDLNKLEYDLIDSFLSDDDLGYLPMSVKSSQGGRIVLSLGEIKQTGEMILIYWKKTGQGSIGIVKSKSIKSFGSQSRNWLTISSNCYIHGDFKQWSPSHIDMPNPGSARIHHMHIVGPN